MAEGSIQPTIFGWADTPWTVAALLGAWGVMIGIEEFLLADIFMVLAGVSCTARLARDCFVQRRRRWVPFVLWLTIILTVVGVDIHLTERKKASSEAKAGEIARLTGNVGQLNATIQQQSVALSAAQGHTDQHVSDIQGENKRLRASIDKKDAALVKIAQDQYALNFFPQIVISTNGSTESMFITNNGKTNVEIVKLNVDGKDVPDGLLVQTIAPGAFSSFTTNAPGKEEMIRRGGTGGRVAVDGILHIKTLDRRNYKMTFIWYYEIKDQRIDKSYVTDGPIVKDDLTPP